MKPISALVLSAVCAMAAPAWCADAEFDVDVTLINDFDKDQADLPVFIQVFRVFGRGVDYAKFNRDGFHIYDNKDAEVEFMLRPVPPDFCLANDEFILVIPKMVKGESLKFRFTNTGEKSARETIYDVEKLLANANNQVPNGDFEKGQEGWTGGKVVTDVVRSGKSAMLLEVPGAGGKGTLTCSKDFSFIKGKNYYFGIWAKCENVVRRTWRYHMAWALAPISGRITLSGDPLMFVEYDGNVDKNHLIRLMDNRDWYCYENNALSTLAIPAPAINTCQSTLALNLDQEAMPYLNANKPARIWVDEVMLFEQPKIEISAERIGKKLTPDGFFLYRRAPTCLSPGAFGFPWQDSPHPYAKIQLPPLESPRPYEKIEKINEVAVQGERKTITLGVNTLKPIQGLCLEGGDLKGPNGAALDEAVREIEFYYTPTVDYKSDGNGLEGWALDGNSPRNIDRPGFVDYLVAYRIAANAAPGKYQGTIKVKGDGKELGEVPVELEIVDFPLKIITDHFVGSIDNGGCPPEQPGVVAPPARDETFYKFYSRCNFSYMMMFQRFLPFTGNGVDVDLPKLVELMKNLRDVAGVTAGVGIYWDCTLDKSENGRGLWTRSGKNQDVYRAQVQKMTKALADAGVPPLVYMIWDEPRFCDPVQFGILKGTVVFTTCDINYKEACDSLKLGLFTHLSVDAPGCDYGPMFREYADKCGAKIGWDTVYGPLCHRYQTSFMLPHGGQIISQWHLGYHLVYHSKHQVLARSQPIIGIGEGMIDFRYFETLKDTIAAAKAKNAAKQEVAAAEKYLKEILHFCTDDYHCMSNTEIFTYNGGPERWGDDWFYERWRTGLRNHTMAILTRMAGATPKKEPQRRP